MMSTSIENRALELFHERYGANLRRTDRLFGWLMIGQWLFGIVLAITLSPYSWEGKSRTIHIHVPIAVVLGALISGLPLVLIWKRPGEVLTRHVVAIAQMLWSALLIHLTGGRIETHFHVFGSLAVLAFYRDWRVLVPATVIVAADHLVRQIFWPESVYGVVAPESWRFLEHAFWVVFEDAFLIVSCVVGERETRKLAEQHARVELTEQMERELAIATEIQTAILPKTIEVEGLDVSARMITATEVGGDYYDVIPVSDGAWLGIGDVAGHGLEAGLVMLQAQSAIKAAILDSPRRTPGEVLDRVNRVLFDNLKRSETRKLHMTLLLVRYENDGRVSLAGAHEDAIIWRAATKTCERIESRGTWMGLVEDIRNHTHVATTELAEGDMLVLYTDGLTEAGATTGEAYGVERLCAALESVKDASPKTARDAVLESLSRWSTHAVDDVTILIAQRKSAERIARAS
jgi:serine phosphatase RsbU (regulator of sigma subunit)